MSMSNKQESHTFPFRVGETVRVTLLSSRSVKRHCRRGIVATLSLNEACVLLLPPTEADSFSLSTDRKHARLSPLPCSAYDTSEVEVTVELNQLQALQPFEIAPYEKEEKYSAKRSVDEMMNLKSHGDTLLKLGDEESAVSFYDRSLNVDSSPNIQVGSTVVIQVLSKNVDQWKLLLAEVDCVEKIGDSTSSVSIDINVLATFDPSQIPNGLNDDEEEQTLIFDTHKQYILTILPADQLRFQMRVLLNLTRCFLRLGSERQESEREGERIPHRINPALAGAFLNSAVLSSSLVEVIGYYYHLQFGQGDGVNTRDDNHLVATALLLRAKAWLRKGRHGLAMEDTRRILKAENPVSPSVSTMKEARQLTLQIREEQQISSKRTRKLVKDVCRWIDGVTKDGNSKERERQTEEVSPNESMCTTPLKPIKIPVVSWVALLIILTALVIQKWSPSSGSTVAVETAV